MKIFTKVVAFTSIAFLFCPGLFAQEKTQDFGIWNTFNVSYKLNDNLSLVGTQELRLYDNARRLNLLYTNIGVEYKPVKFLKLGLVYRHIDKFLETNLFSFRHRLMFDASVKGSIRKFEFSYRHRLQAEVKDFLSDNKGHLPEWYSRNKFQVKYELTKMFSPYVSTELRYQIVDPRNPDSNFLWHRIRSVIGTDIKINGKNTFGIYYLVQTEFQIANSENIFILGLEYSLDLN